MQIMNQITAKELLLKSLPHSLVLITHQGQSS